MSKLINKKYIVVACSLISLNSFGGDTCWGKLRAIICCEKNSRCYDLSKEIDLNSISLKDLENIFKQVLFERVPKFMQKSYIINIIKDKRNKECEEKNIDQEKEWWEANEIFKNLLLKYKKKGVELEKDLTNERDGIVFKNIKRLNPEKFNKIQDGYIKLIASFFLSDKDYENYIENVIQKQKPLQNNDNKNNTSKKEIEKFFDENYDESFLKYLSDYTMSHGFYADKDFNTKLNQCIPYKSSSITYRGTKPLNLGHKKPFDMEETKDSRGNVVEWFIEKIKDRVWQEEGLKGYSLDPAVAAYFAMGWAWSDSYSNHVNFRILIRNHYNKTGVELKPLLTKAEKEKKEGVYLPDRGEEEILYPLNSKFEILGIHLSPENTYDINWRAFSRKEDRKVFPQFFIVLDVVQIE